MPYRTPRAALQTRYMQGIRNYLVTRDVHPHGDTVKNHHYTMDTNVGTLRLIVKPNETTFNFQDVERASPITVHPDGLIYLPTNMELPIPQGADPTERRMHIKNILSIEAVDRHIARVKAYLSDINPRPMPRKRRTNKRSMTLA